MRRSSAAIAVAVMAWVAGACGNDSTTTNSSTASAGPTVTAQQLSTALLTVSDLGAGWTETQRDVFETREPEHPSIDPSLWCSAGNGDELVQLAGQQGADVELNLGAPKVSYGIRQQAWSNTDTGRYFAAVKAAAAACSGATWNDTEGNSYTMTPLTGVKIGDESISWTVTIQLVDTSVPASLALHTVARFGAVIMVVQGGAAMSPSPDATAPNYVVIVRAAGDKMAGVLSS